jgi:hypothetical protein
LITSPPLSVFSLDQCGSARQAGRVAQPIGPLQADPGAMSSTVPAGTVTWLASQPTVTLIVNA